MMKNQSSKIIISFSLILMGLVIGALVFKNYLSQKNIKQQTQLVATSAKALESFQEHYFKCNDLSKKTLDNFVRTHELKVRRLMSLQPEEFLRLEQELDNLKAKAEEKLKSCDTSP